MRVQTALLWRSTRYKVAIVLCLLLLGFAIYIFNDNTPFAIAAIVFSALYFIMPIWMGAFWGTYQWRTTPALAEEMEMTVSESELLAKSSMGEGRLKSILGLKETEDHLMIMVGANAYYFVPKSAFMSEQLCQEATERLKSLVAA